MKKITALLMIGILLTGNLTGCGEATYTKIGNGINKEEGKAKQFAYATQIELSDQEITVDGTAISTEESEAVYMAKDIVFYLAGQDFTYGEGTKEDEHTREEADAHTVIHITKPGTYAVTGMLSAGQIAVDLGDEAEDDPEAVVTLILNNVDITCSVAPAIIFYNVYECAAADKEEPKRDVDTSAAGANVVIADGTYNTVKGSYVARIYKSYTLNEEGTEVTDSKKLHKYDGAFYSKMSMNINGDTEGNGVLEICAENEGLDSELHLTINGGNIKIDSGNDGINTNEDGVSVTTINGGSLCINVNGSTGEGDGIDSNGWLVINGGTVVAYACGKSGDSGIDSDMGIHINGGDVLATGNMLDRISESRQNFAVFHFASGQKGGEDIVLKNENNTAVGKWTTGNDYMYLILAGAFLKDGKYSLWIGEKQYEGLTGEGNMGFGGMGGFELPEGMEPGERPELPEGMEPGERLELPEGMEPGERPEMPEGGFGGRGPWGDKDRMNTENLELSAEYEIKTGGNYFTMVSPVEE